MEDTKFTCPKMAYFLRSGDSLPYPAIQLTDSNREDVIAFINVHKNTAIRVNQGNVKKVILDVYPTKSATLEVGQIIVKEGPTSFSIWNVSSFFNVYKELYTDEEMLANAAKRCDTPCGSNACDEYGCWKGKPNTSSKTQNSY